MRGQLRFVSELLVNTASFWPESSINERRAVEQPAALLWLHDESSASTPRALELASSHHAEQVENR